MCRQVPPSVQRSSSRNLFLASVLRARVSRDNQQAQRRELWLDFTRAGSTDTEARLSRLAAWVLQADKLGVDYGLRLPGQQVAPDAGEAHKRRCLEALALC